MPNILQGNTSGQAPIFNEDLKYEYPNNLRLKPGSKLHKKLVKEILQRASESATMMSQRFHTWRKMDEIMTTFIELDDEEKNVKDADPRKPVSIVFPYSYAIMETILAYMVAAFFQEPIFRYEGNGPDDTIGAIMLEKVVNTHVIKSKVPVNLHTFFRDSFIYGVGICAPVWRVKTGKKTIRRAQTRFSKLLSALRDTGKFEKATEKAILFEGNALDNIDPYKYLPDTNVPIHEVQNGEYVGWVEETNLQRLRADEATDSDTFNVEYLKAVKGRRTSIYNSDDSGRNKKSRVSPLSDGSNTTNPVDVIHMYVDLIPKEWGLGVGEEPEKWVFALAGDAVIIKASPTSLDHGMFPVVVAAPDTDGYSSIPISRLEILSGLQGVLDWLFNSHIANVRKSINDMFLIDPYSVNINDVKNPSEGKLIRTRRPIWGKGVKDVMAQLPVTDITRANISDTSFIVNWMQKIGASDDSIMGSVRQGGPERLPSAEAQGAMQGASNRLQRIAMLISFQAMQDIGYLFASHTQQLMSQEVYVKTVGETQDRILKEFGAESEDRHKVTPFDLLVDYDVLVRDGSIPGSNFSSHWLELFRIIAGDEELRQKFDIARIFKHIARNLNAKNVDEFEVRVVPDEQVRTMMANNQVQPVPREGSENGISAAA